MDRIDYNIQSVATSVEEGFKQLQKVLFSLMLLLYLHRYFGQSLRLQFGAPFLWNFLASVSHLSSF